MKLRTWEVALLIVVALSVAVLVVQAEASLLSRSIFWWLWRG